MSNNKKVDKLILIIGVMAIILSVLVLYISKNMLYASIIIVIALLGLVIYKEYENRKTTRELNNKLSEYRELFKVINDHRVVSKEQILEFDIPHELRMLIERSIVNKVSYSEYQDLLSEDYPLYYRKMIGAIYFLVEENGLEEWDELYLEFIQKEKDSRKNEIDKERKSKESLCYLTLVLFVVIVLVFLFPTIKEVIYGNK